MTSICWMTLILRFNFVCDYCLPYLAFIGIPFDMLKFNRENKMCYQ